MLLRSLVRTEKDRNAKPARRAATHRRWRNGLLRLEELENRIVPSGAGYSPAQISQAYGFNLVQFNSGSSVVQGTGAGQTIAIVSAYNDPDIGGDLNSFSTNNGLPTIGSGLFTFTVLNENGVASPLPGNTSPVANWAKSESIDVEWVHALAPQANIVLLEANSAQPGDLYTAVNTARNLSGVSVVCMDFGGEESLDESAYDSYFTTPSGHNGITFVAESGATGQPVSYPATSPNVLAVGGTALTLGDPYASPPALPVITQELGWDQGGGGTSAYEPAPGYQSQMFGVNATNRVDPDVAFAASDSTGQSGVVMTYDSFDDPGSPVFAAFGTGVGAAAWSALIAVADQGRALDGLGTLDGPSQTLPDLYSLPQSDFNEIASNVVPATGGTGNAAPAAPGYNAVTGLGSPNVRQIVADLSGNSPTSALFSDNFDRTTLGSNYAAQAGTSTIHNDQLSINEATTDSVTTYQGASLANVTVTAGITLYGSARFQLDGLVARYTGPGDANYYQGFAQWTGSTFTFYIFDAFATELAVGGSVAGTSMTDPDNGISYPTLSGTLQFSVQGGELSLYYNGTLEAQCYDTTVTGSGLTGVSGYDAGVTPAFFTSYSVSPDEPTGKSIPFSDNFDRSNSSTAGPGWVPQTSGASQISNDRLALTSTADTVTTVNTQLAADVNVSAGITLYGSARFQLDGLVARYTGPGDANYYQGFAQWTGSTFTFYIFDAFATDLVTGGSVAGTSMTDPDNGISYPTLSGTLQFIVQGNELSLYYNGTLEAQCFNSAITGPGLTGVTGYDAGVTPAFFSSFSAAAATTPPTTFSDNFDRTTLGSNYVAQAGTSTIHNDQLSINDPTTDSVTTYEGIDLANVNVSAGITLYGSSTFQLDGLVARYTGPGDANYYQGFAQWTGSTFTFYIFEAFSTDLVTGGSVAGTSMTDPDNGISYPTLSGTLQFIVQGNELSLYYNGTLEAQCFNSAITGPGLTGVTGYDAGVTPAFFSSFSVSADTTPQSVPFSDNFDRTTLGSNYVAQAGTSTIHNDQLSINDPTTDSVTTYEGANLTNVDVSAGITLYGSSTFQLDGLVARYTGPGDANYYQGFAQWTGSTFTFYIFEAFSTDLVTGGSVAGTSMTDPDNGISYPTLSGTLQFEVEGSELSLYYNGTLEARCFNSAITGPGLTGVTGYDAGVTPAFFSSYNVAAMPPFTDNFASSSSLNNWVTQSGSFSVSSGQLQATGSGTNVATVNSGPLADVNVAANVSVPATAGDYAVLVARYTGPGNENYYEAGVQYTGSGYEFDIWSVNSSGTRTALVTAVSASSGSGHLLLQIEDNELQLFWNGEFVTDYFASDSTIVPGLAGVAATSGSAFSGFSLNTADGFTDQMEGTTTLPPDWTQTDGTSAITVSSGVMTAESSGLSDAIYDNGSLVNADVSAVVTLPDTLSQSQDVFLVARYQGGDLYEAGIINSYSSGTYTAEAGIWLYNSSGYTEIGSLYSAGADTVWLPDTNVEFKVTGSSFGLYVGGQLLASGTDTHITTAGAAGVRFNDSGSQASQFFLSGSVGSVGSASGGGFSMFVSRGGLQPLSGGAITSGSPSLPSGGPAALERTALADLVFGASSTPAASTGASTPAGTAIASEPTQPAAGSGWYPASLNSLESGSTGLADAAFQSQAGSSDFGLFDAATGFAFDSDLQTLLSRS